MTDEQIIRKEGNLRYGKKRFDIFEKRGQRGSLILTASELSFVEDKGKKTLSIPVREIMNVRATPLKNQNALIIEYTDGSEEKKATIWYRGEIGLTAFRKIFAEPYFKSWEELIEKTRLSSGS